MDSLKYALLIDSDNVSSKYVNGILEEITKYGIVTYKRIYGDWTMSQSNKWKDVLLSNAIVPIQQFSNTVGKNATDSTLIIDAMDILYGGKVDGFCIVSSDSDFTRLVNRLRESGMSVIGMGETKTPSSFRNACTKFILLENLLNNDEKNVKETKVDKLSQEKITSEIADIIIENQNKGRITGLGEIGSRLSNKYPDFDVRNYGYSYLSKFIEEMEGLKLVKKDNAISVIIKDDPFSIEQVSKYILKVISQRKNKEIDLSLLSNRVRKEFPNFKLKDFGYSRFSKFVQSLKGVSVLGNGTAKRRVVLKNNK